LLTFNFWAKPDMLIFSSQQQIYFISSYQNYLNGSWIYPVFPAPAFDLLLSQALSCRFKGYVTLIDGGRLGNTDDITRGTANRCHDVLNRT
jgi:hypothetical protein